MRDEIIARHRFASRTLIVDLEGRLTLSPALNELKTRIEALISAKPAMGLALNLAGVSAIDSSGIGELMKIHTFAMRRRLRLVLFHVNPKIREMLKITRLDGLFDVGGDETSALQQIAQAEVTDQAQ